MSKSKILWSVCLCAVLVLAICVSAGAQIKYTTKLSSGPFLVAPTAQSVDWAVLNNDTVSVDLRVTVYKYGIGADKEEVSPGSLEINLLPNRATHNANSVGTVFVAGYYYEVVIEATTDKICPNVNQWSSNGASDFIPGTLIPSGDFVSIFDKKAAKQAPR